MSRWWPWLIVVLPGGGIVALGIWLRRRWLASEAAAIQTLIQPPVQRFEKLSAKDYDDVRKEAVRRQAAVSYRQKQSAQIASGENPPEARRIEIVR